MSARRPRKNRRASGGQLPRRSSTPGFSRKWTADGTRRGASSGSWASTFRQTARSSTRRGLPWDSSQHATPEFVVPRSSAQLAMEDPIIAGPWVGGEGPRGRGRNPTCTRPRATCSRCRRTLRWCRCRLQGAAVRCTRAFASCCWYDCTLHTHLCKVSSERLHVHPEQPHVAHMRLQSFIGPATRCAGPAARCRGVLARWRWSDCTLQRSVCTLSPDPLHVP